ncbi:MAG: alpha/beta hydrolase, partial [Sphingobacteriia bacterium]|nr:alpha/beta hydrolase [Sphingobacteriia bacterium]
MKKTFLLLGLLLTACTAPNPLKDRNYEVIPAGDYALATWHNIQKSTQGQPLKVYIEGDGNAFNRHGIPTNDPTPKGLLMRELSAGDNSPNVVYLGRP